MFALRGNQTPATPRRMSCMQFPLEDLPGSPSFTCNAKTIGNSRSAQSRAATRSGRQQQYDPFYVHLR